MSSRICQHDECGNLAETGSEECFRHRVMTVGYSWRGGARYGRNAFHMTKTEFLRENLDVGSEKELAKTRPDVGRADP